MVKLNGGAPPYTCNQGQMSACTSSCHCIAFGRFILSHSQKGKNLVISDRNEVLEIISRQLKASSETTAGERFKQLLLHYLQIERVHFSKKPYFCT